VARNPLAPAEAYAAARSRAARPRLAEFTATLPFELDGFQHTACSALEDGHGVLVCAPTGAGKTVVGEFAVHLALASGQKCFYTTPIKALSNQKYADLVARHGAAAVGLLTGDTSVNPNAQVVVMTTEVLRNMIYAEAGVGGAEEASRRRAGRQLEHLGYVVMDEVHYLADRFRGAVWEEVILQLPEHVKLVSLSATVSNAEEFGDWLVTVRGDTAVVVDEHRPVPLWQHMMVGNRLLDLFAGESAGGELTVDPDLVRHTRELERQTSMASWDRGRGRGGNRGAGGNGRSGERFRPPSRTTVIDRLDRNGLLPAITFVFSRAGCDAAVGQCVRSGLRLTTEDEAVEIRRTVERRTADLPHADLAVLGYWEWREALERGIAAHHAGMLPRSRRPSRSCSSAAWSARCSPPRPSRWASTCRPARGAGAAGQVQRRVARRPDPGGVHPAHRAGRAPRHRRRGHAGRRLAARGGPRAGRRLASTRTYPLRSSFRPGYNMAVNLVGRLGTGAARELLEQSLGQFQADRSVVGISRRTERNTEALAGYADSMRCHLGDFAEYAALRRRVAEREKALSREGVAERRDAASSSLRALRPGDVIAVPGGRRAGLAVVLDPGLGGDGEDPRPLVLTEDRWAGRLSSADFPAPVAALGRMRLPKRVDHRAPAVRRDLASSLRVPASWRPHHRGGGRGDTGDDPELGRCAARCGRTPATAATTGRPTPAGRSATRAWSGRPSSCGRSAPPPRTRWRARSTGSGRLLGERGYLEGRHRHRARGAPGPAVGRVRTCSPRSACARACGTAWMPAELAAVVSALVYESRRVEGPVPRVPSGPVSEALGATVSLWSELEADERRHRVERTREPDLGFAWPMHRWARGESLAAVLTAAEQNGAELSAGDFVRWCRQVLDLLDQIVGVAGRDSGVGRAAAGAVSAIRRGVVAVGTA
jgi:ATP-dependent RNA helicase HelY